MQEKLEGETFPHRVVSLRAQVGLHTYTNFKVYPLMDQPGLRCTATLPADINNQGPIELQLNFFGTIDWASKAADVDEGGPGQETLKRHEVTLLKQVHSVL